MIICRNGVAFTTNAAGLKAPRVLVIIGLTFLNRGGGSQCAFPSLKRDQQSPPLEIADIIRQHSLLSS